MSTKLDTKKSAKASAAHNKQSQGFTADEKAAMRARALELKAEARASKNKEEGEKAVLAAIAEMPEPDRSMAARLHELIKTSAPDLMPKVVCFFQNAQKFKARYATFGFSDTANLDEGAMWPTSFALKELTATEEARIIALVKRAVS
jgi:uncharacterized protein YdhG (YjbR/CyaY superfamily)